jgi:hypothetical protein
VDCFLSLRIGLVGIETPRGNVSINLRSAYYLTVIGNTLTYLPLFSRRRSNIKNEGVKNINLKTIDSIHKNVVKGGQKYEMNYQPSV